ncbi:hypothetical protein [Undibacterium squillarum]|uniref:Tail assembly chaperone n=1 Tax=Undibacterium squillarum TaxID=1131567 RepID=A0ABQ2Y2D2_9BURK|nr:hypothetical protein [Undibacterium squillarum]GGX52988.1 hypothetical protein GCM10010946_34470 [Undibacterium squillarum]
MFVFRKEIDQPVTWPVFIEMAQDGGKVKKVEFKGKFLRLNNEQRKKIDEELDDISRKEGEDYIDAAVLRISRFMVGWSDIVDEDNKPIEYSQEALREIAKGPVGMAFITAVTRAVTEIDAGIKAKN